VAQNFEIDVGRCHHQQRIAVGGSFCRLARSDDARCARTVFDHEGCFHPFAELLREIPRHQVGRPAGAKRHDQPDRPGRIVIREQA